MSELRIHLFGAPRVVLGDRAVAIPRRKALALLAYLAASPQPYSRDALATLFWPEHDQESARAHLRRTLSEVKNAAGSIFEADRMQIVPNKSLWLDTAIFEDRLSAAQHHDHPAGQPCPTCQPALAEAVALYTGDFMAGFTLPDSPDFDMWQSFKAESLRRSLAEALQLLIEWHTAQGEYEAAIGYGRRWVALDTLHEPAHGQLMRLYALAGQPGAALRQYEICRDILSEELGIEPDPATTGLYEAIRARTIGPPAARSSRLAAVPELAPQVAPHNLPPQLTPFIGREKELAEVQQLLLADPPYRLVTIVGPGGIGKTRLAQAVGHDLAGSFAHGVYLVSFAQIESSEHLLPTLAGSLGLRLSPGVDPREQVLSLLRSRHMLLILDNFEHLLDASAIVSDILEFAPRVSVLVTSRERLNQSGEAVYSLGSLAFPEANSPDQIHQALGYEAVILLVQSAQRARPDLELTPDNVAAAVRICHLVQGMPLAIVLAGAWFELLSLNEIADEIERSLDFLEADMRDLPERQHSVRAAFDYSWKRLSPVEQRAFARLSVFRGGFTRRAAQDVTGTDLRALRTLINKSFVTLNSADRYEIHELLRQFGAEKLALMDECEATCDAHSRYYLDLVARLEQNPGDGEGLHQIEVDLDNIRQAWTWAFEKRDVPSVDRALQSLFVYDEWRSQQHEG